MTLRPQDPIIRIKNEWKERKEKTICNWGLSFLCARYAFEDKGSGKVQNIFQEFKVAVFIF